MKTFQIDVGGGMQLAQAVDLFCDEHDLHQQFNAMMRYFREMGIPG